MEEKEQKEITIAYGNEIQLTTTGKKDKQVFVKFSPKFREKQLKELKGAPLSVFICYALHSNENGYTWIDTKHIQKETGFNRIDLARKVLIKKKYLYKERLFNKDGLLRDYIYRIFQPIEYKEFIIRGEKLTPSRKNNCTAESDCQAQNEIVIEDKPVSVFKEEEPFSKSEDLQSQNNSSSNEKKETNPAIPRLFNYFTERTKEIANFEPEIAYGKEGRLLATRLKKYSEEDIKDLIDFYLESRESEKLGCSLSIALSTWFINKWKEDKSYD